MRGQVDDAITQLEELFPQIMKVDTLMLLFCRLIIHLVQILLYAVSLFIENHAFYNFASCYSKYFQKYIEYDTKKLSTLRDLCVDLCDGFRDILLLKFHILTSSSI